MDHILNLIHEAGRQKMAKPEKIVEQLAQIVWYLEGNPTPCMVRYTDLKQAVKQYDKFVEWVQAGKSRDFETVAPHFVLTGASSTCTIFRSREVQSVFLVDLWSDNGLQLSTSKRFNAMQQSA